jgi:hypothetical protein
MVTFGPYYGIVYQNTAELATERAALASDNFNDTIAGFLDAIKRLKTTSRLDSYGVGYTLDVLVALSSETAFFDLGVDVVDAILIKRHGRAIISVAKDRLALFGRTLVVDVDKVTCEAF